MEGMKDESEWESGRWWMWVVAWVYMVGSPATHGLRSFGNIWPNMMIMNICRIATRYR